MSRAGWFSLSYPIGWELEEDEYAAVYNPDGVGALYISSYEAPGPVDPKKELSEHLSDQKPSVRSSDIHTWTEGDKTLASSELVDQQSFQKTWFIGRDSYLVIATYNCEVEDKDIERNEIEEIVRSIQIKPKFLRN